MATAGMSAAILENETLGQGCHELHAREPSRPITNYVVYCGSFLEPTFL